MKRGPLSIFSFRVVKQMTKNIMIPKLTVIEAQTSLEAGRNRFHGLVRGEQYPTGDKLRVVRSEFSTLSLAVLFQSNVTA